MIKNRLIIDLVPINTVNNEFPQTLKYTFSLMQNFRIIIGTDICCIIIMGYFKKH